MDKIQDKYKRKLINPIAIPQQDFPLICLVDSRRGLIPWIIKAHTSGEYHHVMEQFNSFFVASQDFAGFRKVHITKYMKPHLFLKFWKVELIPSQRAEWINLIHEDIKKGGKYDFRGILGQLLRLTWIQDPKKYFCSEKVADHQNKISDIELPPQPSPNGLDRLFSELEALSVYGYYFMEEKLKGLL